MAMNEADAYPYSVSLTRFSIEKGSGGGLDWVDQLAIPTPVETQNYAIPHFESNKINRFVDTKVGPSGRPNKRDSLAGTITPGRCERRGLEDFVKDEDDAAPGAVRDLLPNINQIQEEVVHSLRLERAVDVLAALDAAGLTYFTTPSVKWDQSNATIKLNWDAGKRTAAKQCGGPEGGTWWAVMGPDMADFLSSTDEVLELVKYTDKTLLVNGQLPPVLWGCNTMIPTTMLNGAKPGQTASPDWLIPATKDNVYFVYSNPAFSRNRRSFTALAQPRWAGPRDRPGALAAAGGGSNGYATKTFRDPVPSILKTWVSTDIYDNFETLAATGIHVLKDLRT